MEAVKGLLASRKAVMVLVVFVVLAVLVGMGRLDPSLLEQFLQIVVPSWLVAHAGEEGAKALASRGLPRGGGSE